jgi:hypothetical protein
MGFGQDTKTLTDSNYFLGMRSIKKNKLSNDLIINGIFLTFHIRILFP